MAAPLRSTSSPEDRQTIVCLHCGKPQEVGRRAMSITCKFCNKSLKLEDNTFNKYEARRTIETLGTITIDKKGNVVVTDKINCSGLVVRGKIKGDVRCRGTVLVGPEAEIKGNVTAQAIAVGAGAILEGKYEIGPKVLPGSDNGKDDKDGKTQPDQQDEAA